MTFDRWVRWNFKAESTNSGEYKFPCPKCRHPKFYFNPTKRLGYCHRASCHFKPNLEMLCDVVKISVPVVSPRQVEGAIDTVRQACREIELPYGAEPLITIENEQRVTRDQDSIDYLLKRGLTTDKILRHNIHSNVERIIVPIYENGKLVQYLGRSKGDAVPKYMYNSHSSISRYFFDWDYIKTKNTITLVENTFNAIWLQDALNATSIFGSYLGTDRAQKIIQSGVKRVVTMLDEGVRYKNYPTLQLRTKGIQVIWINILEEPESYSLEFLQQLYDIALVSHQQYFDAKDLCREYLSGN